MTSKRVYEFDNEAYVLELQRLFIEDQDDPVGEVLDEANDTDSSEHIEERDGSSDSEQNDSDGSIASDNENENCYIALRKKNGKITDNYVWEKTPYNRRRRLEKQNILVRLPGVIGNARQARGCLEIWQFLFDDTILNLIVTYTNQHKMSVQVNFSRDRDARTTDLTEIKSFIGLLYLVGLYKGGRLNSEELWDTEGNGVEIFRLTMGLKRFRFLFRSIRFDNRETRDERKNNDRLASIREICEMFVTNSTKCYSLRANVTIDEKLEAFCRKCNFIQYIPSRPAKCGIEIFAFVDAKTYYTSNMEIYAGLQPDGSYSMSNKSIDVVKRMISPIYNTGGNVTMDNRFCDVSLLQDLSTNHKLFIIGTLKKNKWQIPNQLKILKYRSIPFSMFGFRKEGTIVSYVPKKNEHVVLISSLHFDDKIDESTGDKMKPEIIPFYNVTKAGVDVVDKLCSSYNVARNTGYIL
nr:piggyBac transposable element-derived protein 4-like [Leptinotarsa decemlineata]